MDAEELTNMSMALYKEIHSRKDKAENKIVATLRFYEENANMGSVLMIEANDLVIGYAIVFKFWSDEYGGLLMGIDELFIRRDYREKFIAKNFIKSLIEEFKSNPSFAGVELESHAGNEVANKLFAAMGLPKNENNFYLYLLKSKN